MTTKTRSVSQLQKQLNELKNERVGLVTEIKEVEQQLVVAKRQQEQAEAQHLLGSIQKTNK